VCSDCPSEQTSSGTSNSKPPKQSTLSVGEFSDCNSEQASSSTSKRKPFKQSEINRDKDEHAAKVFAKGTGSKFEGAWLQLEQQKLELRKTTAQAQEVRVKNREGQKAARVKERAEIAARKSKEILLPKAEAGEEGLEQIEECKGIAAEFLAKLENGDVKMSSDDALDEDGCEAGGDAELLGRAPGEWENIYSWLVSLPANTIPSACITADGALDKKKLLIFFLKCMHGINRALAVDQRFNFSKLTVALCVEKPLTKGELELILDDEDTTTTDEHAHFALNYTGRACRTSFLWEKALRKMGLIADVRTFENVVWLGWSFLDLRVSLVLFLKSRSGPWILKFISSFFSDRG
jgi:hypothetical protein